MFGLCGARDEGDSRKTMNALGVERTRRVFRYLQGPVGETMLR